MERLTTQKPSGMNGDSLRTWGLFFLAAGVIGRGLLQTHILGIGQLTALQLLETMNASQTAMTMVTISLVLQAMETCAVPIFAMMLVEGVQHTSDFKAYMLRVTGLALIAEIPYNLAFSGKILAMDARNPVFGLVLSMVMLYFFRQYAGFGIKQILIKVFVAVASVIWCRMLSIDSGICVVLVVAVLWTFRKKALYRNFAGAIALVLCTAVSPFYLAAPMGFLAVFFYNGEEGTNSRTVKYLAYPVILLVTGLLGMFVL